MKILVDGKEVSRLELGEVLEEKTNIKQYGSFSALQKVWCKCKGCGESREFNTPMTALDFVDCHRKCNSIIDIQIAKECVEAGA